MANFGGTTPNYLAAGFVKGGALIVGSGNFTFTPVGVGFYRLTRSANTAPWDVNAGMIPGLVSGATRGAIEARRVDADTYEIVTVDSAAAPADLTCFFVILSTRGGPEAIIGSLQPQLLAIARWPAGGPLGESSLNITGASGGAGIVTFTRDTDSLPWPVDRVQAIAFLDNSPGSWIQTTEQNGTTFQVLTANNAGVATDLAFVVLVFDCQGDPGGSIAARVPRPVFVAHVDGAVAPAYLNSTGNGATPTRSGAGLYEIVRDSDSLPWELAIAWNTENGAPRLVCATLVDESTAQFFCTTVGAVTTDGDFGAAIFVTSGGP
jgi:hypothetical protein